MLNRIITWSLEHRLLVLTLALIVVGTGVWSMGRLPIDASPDAPVVLPQRIEDVIHRQVVLEQPCRLDDDLILLAFAAPRVDLGDARHREKLGLDDPVMDGGQLLEAVGV